jgi:DNA-binding NarL/FixJ family response regulator
MSLGLMNVAVLPLSPKEQLILSLFDQGKSYKEISSAVGCSINTLKSHARHILAKTIADNLRHAAYLRRPQIGNPLPLSSFAILAARVEKKPLKK